MKQKKPPLPSYCVVNMLIIYRKVILSLHLTKLMKYISCKFYYFYEIGIYGR